MTPVSTSEFYRHLTALRDETDAVIATMTACLEWPQYSEHSLDLGFMAPMGSASSVGLGLALAQPGLGVIVIDGDGSILMNLGSLVTIGGQRPPRLLHIVLENAAYDITGGQRLPGSGTQQLPEMALSLGYARGRRSNSPRDLEAAVDGMHRGEGPILLAVPVRRSFDMKSMPTLAHDERCLRSLGKPGADNMRRILGQLA